MTFDCYAATINLAHTMKHEHFNELLSTLAEQSGLTVNSVLVDQKALKVRLVQNTSTSTSTDVVIVPADHLGLDKYANYSVIPDSLIADTTDKRTLETAKLNNTLLGIPIIQGNHLLLFYNKQFVKEPIENWQDIYRIQSSLPEKVKLVTWSFMEMYWFIPFLSAFNGDLIVDNHVQLNTPAMQSALKFVWDLNKQNLVDRQCDYTCSNNAFKAQQAAFTIDGAWALKTYEQALGDNLAVQQLPKLNGEYMQPYYSTFVLAFPNDGLNGVNKDNLIKFAKLVQAEKFQTMIWQKLQDIPVNTEVLNSLKSQQGTELATLIEAMQFTKPMPSTASMIIVWEVLNKGFIRYGSGALTAEQAGLFMQGLAERSIANEGDE
ncbi:extracellular solute-binding protein [Pseudoalteromonas sp. ACER1]|uniref:sugar ABC transporter substrate-binding protein n=1 Tax=unclassified Pseudoalteromonas TaxID=194690 RepID=UPI001F30492A|nr:extracellular solute-binding protein [Pseudoalteromonas sp. PAST1]MCF2849777.1 extracellular solute-binding protein [Pseudoalteromonas sp. PAST1]MCO7212200.1 extracellular solute-binding protein [Pseudoalteromonas sp. ACER1]